MILINRQKTVTLDLIIGFDFYPSILDIIFVGESIVLLYLSHDIVEVSISTLSLGSTNIESLIALFHSLELKLDEFQVGDAFILICSFIGFWFILIGIELEHVSHETSLVSLMSLLISLDRSQHILIVARLPRILITLLRDDVFA